MKYEYFIQILDEKARRFSSLGWVYLEILTRIRNELYLYEFPIYIVLFGLKRSPLTRMVSSIYREF